MEKRLTILLLGLLLTGCTAARRYTITGDGIKPVIVRADFVNIVNDCALAFERTDLVGGSRIIVRVCAKNLSYVSDYGK